jgi:heptosyltransferase-2
MRIALIKIGATGDVVRTTSILPGLRRLHSDMELTWITSTSALDLVRNHPDVLRAVDIAESSTDPWRRDRYDWLISLDDDPIACQLASELNAARLSGAYMTTAGQSRYTCDTEPWFGMGLLRPPEEGGIDRANQLKQANQLSHGAIFYRMLGLPPPIARPNVVVHQAQRQWAADWWADSPLHSFKSVVGMNTGAGGRWEFKKWGEDQTAQLANRLLRMPGVGVLLLGGPSELSRSQRIAALCDRPGVVVAPHDLTLLCFSALVGRCDVLLSSDSLALHLGLAADIPVVTFFGPTSAAEIDVYGKGEKVVTPLSCRCCYLATCDIRPQCMASIPVQRMFEAVTRWIPALNPVANKTSSNS